MKKLIIALTALLVSVAAYGQGQFGFNNRSTADGIDAKFTLPDGTSTALAGDAYSVQVLAGPQGGAMAVVGTTSFRTGAAAGYVVGITPSVPGLTEGQTASVALRFWQGAAGTGTLLGEKAGYSVVVHEAPNLPVLLALGTSPIVIPVPEPSTFALAALGLGALLAIRRRK
jgi:MYXO-CTERM domain-containing protein